MAMKIEDKKLEEYENENYCLLWWLDQWLFPHNNCLGLSDIDNSISRTDNFVNVNVFNSVTLYISSCALLLLHLHYFLTMPVGFNFNLTFRLKP